MVVPGYLVPLLIAKPWSALAIIIVAIYAYIQFYFLSEVLSKWGLWGNFFGRDRFFGLLLSGVIARLLFDAVIFPTVGALMSDSFSIDFDYRNNLHSFGLIVVTLLANQFWKPGLKRGLLQFGVILGISFLLVRYVLMVYTNFSIANLQFMYEGISESLVASPKAYIILLTAAYLASRFNMFYGWDFNGILLPSLLALQLYDLSKIFTSFVEAWIIYLLASLVLKTPFLRESSIEGARKLALFFNVSFFYKMGLGYVILRYFPEYQVSDYFGFGYLLPTLMSMKMHEKKIVVRYTATTLATAIIAAVAGNIIGFGLTIAPSLWKPNYVVLEEHASLPPVQVKTGTLRDIILEGKIRMYARQHPDSFQTPLPYEQSQFREGIVLLMKYTHTHDEADLLNARLFLNRANYIVERVEDQYLYLHEKQPENGWGIYAVDYTRDSGLLVEIPSPIEEWRTLESGLILLKSLNGKAYAASGAKRNINRNGSSDVLIQPGSFFHIFHEIASRRNVLQIRGYTEKSIRVLTGITEAINPTNVDSTLWIRSQIPAGLNPSILKSLIGEYRVEWKDGPFKNIQRELTWSGFAELWLNRKDRRSLLAQAMDEKTEIKPETFVTRIDGYLYDWLMNTKGEIADKGSDLYKPPTEDEMLYFDQEVVTPLIKIIDSEFVDGAFTSDGLSEFHTISNAASIIGYRFIWYRHKLTNQNYLILTEREAVESRTYRGTFVFRLEKSNPFLVHVTRPLYEQNSFEYGVELFERIQARAILISGAHRDCNLDGAANIISLKNKNNFLNLVNQVLLREMKSKPMLVISCRAFGIRQDAPTTDSEAIVSFADGTIDQSSFSYLGKMFLDYLEEDQFKYQLVDGSLETAGYEASNLSQAYYLRQTENKEFVGLWLSPLIRKTYRLKTESILQESHFASLNISTERAVLYDLLDAARQYPGADQIPVELFQDVNHYLRTGNIIALQNLMKTHPEVQFTRLFDINSMQTFLIMSSGAEQRPLVVNLNPRNDKIENIYQVEVMNEENLEKYIASRFAWLDWNSVNP